MSHEILEHDSMFSVRLKPWHYGETADRVIILDKNPVGKDVLVATGLNWKVVPRKICLDDGTPIPGYTANWIPEKGICNGINSNRYVSDFQNEDAADLLCNLLQNPELEFETGGSLSNCKRIWLMAKMPDARVVGEDVEPYIVITNTFDGSGALRVCLTPIRVVCNNTLNYAFHGAHRSWSTRHTGNVMAKVKQAQQTLELAQRYMIDLDEFAYQMCDVRVDEEALKAVLDICFPKTEKMTEREKKTMDHKRDQFMICYFMPDIAQFRGTGWGVLNAMSDFVGHAEPMRHTKSYEENRWVSIMDGAPLIDRATAAVAALAKK